MLPETYPVISAGCQEASQAQQVLVQFAKDRRKSGIVPASAIRHRESQARQIRHAMEKEHQIAGRSGSVWRHRRAPLWQAGSASTCRSSIYRAISSSSSRILPR